MINKPNSVQVIIKTTTIPIKSNTIPIRNISFTLKKPVSYASIVGRVPMTMAKSTKTHILQKQYISLIL